MEDLHRLAADFRISATVRMAPPIEFLHLETKFDSSVDIPGPAGQNDVSIHSNSEGRAIHEESILDVSNHFRGSFVGRGR